MIKQKVHPDTKPPPGNLSG